MRKTMSKYRIVTNGDSFMVQKKYWNLVWMFHQWETEEGAVQYDNLMAAKEHVLFHTRVDAKKSGKWLVIE